ncbi:MAG: hypothetical protein DI559_15785, partial [Ectopseudomonas oleovorans]
IGGAPALGALAHRRQRHRGGGGAGFHAEFHVDMLQVLVHRARAEAEDVADIAVGLAAGDPAQHLHFALGELEARR